VTAAYKTVHKLVHYRLQASPKVVRPRSAALAEAQLEHFKKKLAGDLAMLVWFSLSVLAWGGGIRFFCDDETRLGLKTIVGRKIWFYSILCLRTYLRIRCEGKILEHQTNQS
jgi:hypothetical protein